MATYTHAASHLSPSGSRRRMQPMRKVSLTVDVLFVITFVSIPALALYKAMKDDAGAFVLGAGSTTGVQWGVLSEVIVGLAGIGAAISPQ